MNRPKKTLFLSKMKKSAKVNLATISFSVIIGTMFIFLVTAIPVWHTYGTGNTTIGFEDTPLIYNFTANVTYSEGTNLTFSFVEGEFISDNHASVSPSDYTWVTLNSTTGIMAFNATKDNETGNFSISVLVIDDGGEGPAVKFYFNITPVNDPPYFLNLENRTLNKSSFELILMALDEELDLNYTFNVSFLSCTHEVNDPPTGPENCTLFNLTSYNATATNISFTPQDNQKGEYIINFSVTDNRSAAYSEIANWTVTWNEPPVFTYICDNERNTTEDLEFTCYINASDPDELNNLTFIANYTWFTFNSTATNSTTISTGSTGNASAFVNFTPTDSSVGNWSVNLTVIDTGAINESARSNSSVISFFINNTLDNVVIVDIPDILDAVTSNNYSRPINATDDDLLIPDKNIYNEVVNFTTNDSRVSVINTHYVSGTNRTEANVSFDPNVLGVGIHIINVTANSLNNNSLSSDLFTINITSNSKPEWLNPETDHLLTEDVAFYLNLSKNVTDPGDSLTFSSTLNNDEYDFPSFSISSDGIIDFTPNDYDIGYHNVTIIVTDGKTPSSLEFNFTVINIPDSLGFAPGTALLGVNSPNATINATDYHVTAQEDNYTEIYLQVEDDDFRIEQTDFYEEDLTTTVTIEGQNTTLVTFGDETLVSYPGNNRTKATATFTPTKADVGEYNVTINVTDATNQSIAMTFNLTVLETGHIPNMTEVGNQIVSILNETLYIDVNATDLEDGNEGVGGNLTYILENLTSGGNFLIINESTGVINFTFNETYAGLWQYNLSVNDTDGMYDSELFNVTVYDYPSILFPNDSVQFNLNENTTYQFNFTANHTVQDALNYTLSINGVTRNSTTGYGNATNFLWNFTPNFTDETTCTGTVNLTLNVSNNRLSNVTNWNLNISHTNYPLAFYSAISDKSGGSPISLTLSDYFRDIDASDTCVNQTVTFNYTLINGSGITVSFTDWENATTPLATFTAGSDATANYTLTGTEYNASNSSQLLSYASSNNFTVHITTTAEETPTPTTGGGGASTRIVSLKILVPEPVSAKQKDHLVIPLGVVNDGTVPLYDIFLSSVVAKDGILREDLLSSFDTAYFASLSVGQRKNVTLIVDIDTSSSGLFEVTINGSVRSPQYEDWAKFYLEIEEEQTVLERIVFTEEFVIGNPECAEFADLIGEAKALFAKGELTAASEKAEEALDACKRAISQPLSSRIYRRLGDQFLGYTAIASLAALSMGFVYYYYKKVKLKQALRGY